MSTCFGCAFRPQWLRNHCILSSLYSKSVLEVAEISDSMGNKNGMELYNIRNRGTGIPCNR